MKNCHSSSFAGHAGRDNTIEKIKDRFYWSDYYKETVEMVSGKCDCEYWLGVSSLRDTMLNTRALQFYFGRERVRTIQNDTVRENFTKKTPAWEEGWVL